MKTNHLSELLARCDGSFVPRTLDDFIGRQMIERQSGDTWIGARLIGPLYSSTIKVGFLFLVTALAANAAAPADYYATAEGKAGSELRAALHDIIPDPILSTSSPRIAENFSRARTHPIRTASFFSGLFAAVIRWGDQVLPVNSQG